MALTQEEYEEAKENDPSIRQHVCQFLECGEAKDGYWTSDKFMDQIKGAVKIAKVKYPRKKAGGSFGYLTIVVAMQPCPPDQK